MATKVNRGYSNISRGEISPKFRGAFELQAFYNGAERMSNYITDLQGTYFNRPGTTYIASFGQSFLYRFIFQDEKYLLIFENISLKIYRNDTLVQTIVTPYATADIDNLNFAASDNVMYIVNAAHAPRKLTRTAIDTFTFATYARTSDPFTGVGLYPSVVAFYESRLIMGSTDNNPSSLWFSKAPSGAGVPQFDDFTIGVNDDDALKITLSSIEFNRINWVVGLDRILAVGGSSNVFKLTGERDDSPITPSSIKSRIIGFNGSAQILPEANENYLFYTQNGKRILRSLEFDYLNDSYTAIDLTTTLADHITLGDVKELTFQNGSPDILWFVKNNGELIGMTYKKADSILAYHRHETDGDYESVITLPTDTGYDELYCIVKRVINGSTVRYLEKFAEIINFLEPLDEYTDQTTKTEDTDRFLNLIYEQQKEYIYLDSALSYDGSDRGVAASATLTPGAVTGDSITFTASASVFISADAGHQLHRKSVTGNEIGIAEIVTYVSGTEVTCNILKDFDSTDAIPSGEWFITTNTVTGLSHLEASTVGICADGGSHSDKTVSSGEVEIDFETTTAHVGLKYISLYKSTNLEGGGTIGVAQSKKRNVFKIDVRFLNSLNCLAGTNPYGLDRINFRTALDLTNRPSPLFTGIKSIAYFDKTENEKNLYIVQDLPLPCNIQFIMPWFNTSNTI